MVENLIEGSVNDLLAEKVDFLAYISSQAYLIEKMLVTNKLEESQFKINLTNDVKIEIKNLDFPNKSSKNLDTNRNSVLSEAQRNEPGVAMEQLFFLLRDFTSPKKNKIFDV